MPICPVCSKRDVQTESIFGGFRYICPDCGHVWGWQKEGDRYHYSARGVHHEPPTTDDVAQAITRIVAGALTSPDFPDNVEGMIDMIREELERLK